MQASIDVPVLLQTVKDYVEDDKHSQLDELLARSVPVVL